MARRTGIGSQKDITFGIICLFFTLSACGGGGGGGAGSVTSLAVTQPHHLALSQRPDLPNGSHFRSEYQRVSALPQLSANVAYQTTLPHLTQPHQVQARQWEVQIVMPWEQVPRLFTLMALRHITSQSSNSLKNFTGQSVHFGFQWR